jgi:hypothetical protein
MKKIIPIIALAALLWNCTGSGETEAESTGNIYGIVTVKSSAEPMRATGVELYRSGALLLKTVTYDDGHYEFSELDPGEYELKVVADGYTDAEYSVIVEAGRTARADMQLEAIKLDLYVVTQNVTEINGNSAVVVGTYRTYSVYECGFVYATHNHPIDGGIRVTADFTYHDLITTFRSTLKNLSKGTYYIQAYAKDNRGTEYGEVRSFQIK